MTAYLLRAVSALIAMSVCAFFLVRYVKKNNLTINGTRDAEILTSLRLTGRDIFFVVRCGPEVIAFTVGPQGTCVIGRWNHEDWIAASNHS